MTAASASPDAAHSEPVVPPSNDDRQGGAIPPDPTPAAAMNVSPLRTLIVLGLLLATYLLIMDVTGTHRVPIVQPLKGFPTSLGPWQVLASHKSLDEVIKMLGVDDYIEYTYHKGEGQPVSFYAAFYEAVGTGAGYHSPKNCIPGGGWGIESVKTVEIVPFEGQPPVRISEMLIRNRDQYQVVMYWYQNRGRIIASEYWEKIYLVLDAIWLKRRDGTFVRLMMPVGKEGIPQTEENLRQFAGIAMAELTHFLPGR